MYEELVKLARHCSDVDACITCPVGGCEGTTGLMNRLADVIEQLSRKVEDFESVREISPEAEYAINKHADNLISHMEKLINGLKEKPRWISMIERPPKEELAFYQCYTDAGLFVQCLWTNNRTGLGPLGEWGWRFTDVPPHQKITHWMPLPPAPEPPKEVV